MYRALPPPEHRYGLALQVTAPPAGELHVTMCTVLVGGWELRPAGEQEEGHINWCGEVRCEVRQRRSTRWRNERGKN